MANLTLEEILPAKRNNLPSTEYTYVGLDFGTSTTVISLIEFVNANIHVTPLQISQKYQNGAIIKDARIPTCIAYSKRYNEMYYGAGAYEARFSPLLELGKNVWFEFKTLLGEDVGPRYHNTILDGKEGRLLLENAVDATSIFLKEIRNEVIKELTQKGLSTNIMWSVSVPASFEANQRADLLAALKNADITNIGEAMLIDEPNAAFLSYVDQSSRLPGQTPLVVPDGKPISLLVFDFGAGTCDISILQFQQDDYSGVKSKNVAISHYTEIGGKDIDKMIADKLVNELVPLESSTPDISEQPSRVKERLSHQLLRISEQMKIELCKQVMFHQNKISSKDLNTLYSTFGITPEVKDHQNRVYQLNNVKLTYEDMTEVMGCFINEYSEKSIFNPIKSALKSAGLKSKDIDYILFVGGSAKNPWIQNAIKEYFNESEYLFPEDMQTLVSEGAAIHSYYYNALNHKLINPITGPTINLLMYDGHMKTLVPSGTEIPFEGVEINGLRPQRDKQESIELPICLSTENHILQNLKIDPVGRSCFDISDRVSLKVRITADKTLHVAAKVSSGEAVITQLNPYSSKALSTNERIVAEGRKRFNKMVRRNGGNPTPLAFIQFANALEKADQRRESAEMKEEAYSIDNTSISLNSLAVSWSNAGDKSKAINYYRIAAEQGDLYAIVNLAISIKWSNPEEYRELIIKAFKMNPNNDWVLYNYGEMLKNDGNIEWETFWNDCLKIYMQKMELKTLYKNDITRAITIARALKQEDAVVKLKAYEMSNQSDNEIFNSHNTVTISQIEISDNQQQKLN